MNAIPDVARENLGASMVEEQAWLDVARSTLEKEARAITRTAAGLGTPLPKPYA